MQLLQLDRNLKLFDAAERGVIDATCCHIQIFLGHF